MKKLLLSAAAACAIAAPAMAEEAAGWTLSGNVALTTDYVFRGFSQSAGNPAVSGGFDAAYGKFYAGVWGSSVDFAPNPSMELDLYAGYKPTFGSLSTDIGVVYYAYPSAKDEGPPSADMDYVEVYAKASFPVIEPWSVGGAVFYSPEFTGETGNAWYVEANTAYALTPALSLSGAFGYQQVENIDFDTYLTSTNPAQDSYTTWNVGATYSAAGFGFDLRYSGTDLDDGVAEPAEADDRFSFTIKRAL